MRRRLVFVVLFAFLLAAARPILAQGSGETCPALVDAALDALDQVCSRLGRDTACYGHRQVEATFREPGQLPTFASPADTVPLGTLRAIATSPLDSAREQWGLAVLHAQADVPESLPGQAITFLLMGEAALENETPPEAGPRPMQAFYFSASLSEPPCRQAPNALIIHNSTGIEATLTINGLEFSLASTVVFTLSAVPDQPDATALVVMLVEGTFTAHHPAFTIPLTQPGDALALALNAQGRVDASSQPVDPGPNPALAAILGGACEDWIAAHLWTAAPRRDACTHPPVFHLPPDFASATAYEIGGFGSRCREMNRIRPGESVVFQKGVGRWESPEALRAALAGHYATITLDGQPLPVYYEGPTWHVGGGPPGYGDRARANWIATAGQHTLTSTWSITGETNTCTFTVSP
ncbi:MAG: hypothetical protein HPY64_06185 [Anaerolineae bacterium]|nr:hypothetical protein [Anaerolineae bacterium]